MTEHAGDTIRYELSADDAQRLRELSQEVRSRLREIAQIAASPVGVQVGNDSIVQFMPRDAGRAVDAGDHVEIIIVDGHEVCYGTVGGVPFSESPCGAAMTPG
jgi:hypothetical protein